MRKLSIKSLLMTCILLCVAVVSCSGGENTREASQASAAYQIPEDPSYNMVEIPAGTFTFGTDEEGLLDFVQRGNIMFPGMMESLRETFVIPPRMEQLPAFRMDQFEVTNQEYHAFAVATGYTPEVPEEYLMHWPSMTKFPEWAADFPVVWISQEDARAYCEWRGKRLPSEQEWERAVRGGDGRQFPWGNESPGFEDACYSRPSSDPVGNRPKDVSPFGVYDMAGNVAELTASTQKFGENLHVVVKGGSFDSGVREMFAFYRGLELKTTGRSESVGFRCASDNEPR